MADASDPIRPLVEALNAEAPLKLWSVLVTCLGDVSRDGVIEVSGVALSSFVERMGLQPQAMRVALHRLKRDGWVESRRLGRVGFHRLSDSALTQTRAVAGRIYGPGAGPAPWHLAGMPPDAPDGLSLLPDTLSATPISRRFALICGPLEDVPEDWLLTAPSGRGLPVWVQDVVVEAGCEAEFKALERTLAQIDKVPDTRLERFTLRVLVLHAWRRLILRSSPAAEAALGGARAEISCRARVHQLLDQLGSVEPDWDLPATEDAAS
ncbi:PaaX-like protein [Jannaschia sp. CCS1]|uniref:PaaX-like protein n=1 Tax=Jannaschia sp. (strain CCS1) TaxID=290400 RepID=A0ACD6B873_JANSC|nr:PaaX-like protein [Jannaschia sp. CCS1]ABD53576.1 PaaX-like protein [Jannaschia sp. CCS1]